MMTSHARNYNNEGKNFTIIIVSHLTFRTILRCKQVHRMDEKIEKVGTGAIHEQ